MIARLLAWMDDLLFPPNVLCLSCGRALDEEARDNLCKACGEALERSSRAQEERERLSPIIPPPGICFVHAAYVYEGPVRQLVHRLKYDCIRRAYIPLARPMAFLPAGEEEIIVPVPTDVRRQRKRGYNQSSLLAEHVGKTLGMQVVPALKRKETRRAQTGLSYEERQRNLIGCMVADDSVRGKWILLIDDVYTTGATVREGARALLEAGAVSIGVLTAAASCGIEKGEKDPFALPLKHRNRAKSLKNPDKNRGEL